MSKPEAQSDEPANRRIVAFEWVRHFADETAGPIAAYLILPTVLLNGVASVRLRCQRCANHSYLPDLRTVPGSHSVALREILSCAAQNAPGGSSLQLDQRRLQQL